MRDAPGVTGAGDRFHAAPAVALARGDDPRAAVRLTNAVGALAVTRTGVGPALPTSEQRSRFLIST